MSRKTAKPKTPARPSADPADLISRASPFRWQRGSEAEEAAVEKGGRKIQKSITGLEQLRRTGVIDELDVSAAMRWCRDFELGVHGARNPEVRSSGGGGGVQMWLASVVDVVTRYCSASKSVGVAGERLLIAYVSEGLSIREMSRRQADADVRAWRDAGGQGSAPSTMATHRRRVSEALVEALRTLGQHYVEVDRAWTARAPVTAAYRAETAARAA